MSGHWIDLQPADEGGYPMRVRETVINYAAMELGVAIARGLDTDPPGEPLDQATEQQCMEIMQSLSDEQKQRLQHIATGIVYRILCFTAAGWCEIGIPMEMGPGPEGKS